jgi:hypothetical protein
MALTRFKDARTGVDGPVSGAIIPITASREATASGDEFVITLPAGCGFRVTDVTMGADGVAGNIQAGTTAGGTQILGATTAAVDLAESLSSPVDVSAGGQIFVQFSGVCAEVTVAIWGYFTSPPTSVLQDDRGGSSGY